MSNRNYGEQLLVSLGYTKREETKDYIIYTNDHSNTSIMFNLQANTVTIGNQYQKPAPINSDELSAIGQCIKDYNYPSTNQFTKGGHYVV